MNKFNLGDTVYMLDYPIDLSSTYTLYNLAGCIRRFEVNYIYRDECGDLYLGQNDTHSVPSCRCHKTMHEARAKLLEVYQALRRDIADDLRETSKDFKRYWRSLKDE